MATSYEEKRNQRMEENKKRMEELNIHRLAQSLKPSHNHTIKRKFVKNVNTAPSAPPRRSIRTAHKTPPNYKPKQASIKTFAKDQSENNNIFYQVSISKEDKMNTVNKAKELAFSLGSKFPTFVTPMTLSQVFGSEVYLSETFCRTHLPDHNQVINVIDEEEEEWQFKYSVKYARCGKGWRTFSTAHELLVGDALVFQLTKPLTFKVYIIRAKRVASGF